MSGIRARRRADRRRRRLTAGHHAMAAAASALVVVGAVVGVLAAASGPDEKDAAAREVQASPTPVPLPARSASPSPSPVTRAPSPSGKATASKKPAGPADRKKPPQAPPLYQHPESQVLDWIHAHPGDPRRPLIESRIAARPEAVWFTEYNPGAVRGQVRAVTAGAAAAGGVPVLVPYAIPQRDCGGASEGGAPDVAAYDGWIREFAGGLGTGQVIVILEPDSVADSECLSAGERSARFASLARAGRTIHAANSRAKVYFDAGNSHWHGATKQAALLRSAGAAAGDGIFTNVAGFHATSAEAPYARSVLAALGGPAGLGAVIDTSRNGNGAPPGDDWCDPSGRALGRTPTTRTGDARIDAYLWVKLPGESDGCRGEAGEFSPEYAYELAKG